MLVVDTDCVTRVSVSGCSDYLPRVRRIVACMADSVGMDLRESETIETVLAELCEDAMAREAGPAEHASISLTLTALRDCIVADIPMSEACEPSEDEGSGVGICERVRRFVSHGVQFFRHRTGLRVKMTRRTTAPSLLETDRFSHHHRN